MKYLGYFSKLIGMRSRLSKHGEIATGMPLLISINVLVTKMPAKFFKFVWAGFYPSKSNLYHHKQLLPHGSAGGLVISKALPLN